MEPQLTPPTQPNPTNPEPVQAPPVAAAPAPSPEQTPVSQPQMVPGEPLATLAQPEPIAVPRQASETPIAEPVVYSPESPVQPAAPAPQFLSASQMAKKPKKKLFLVFAILLVIIGAGAGGAFYYISTKPTPDKVFSGYLTTLLQTKSITQNASTTDLTGSLKMDVNDVKQPKISFTATGNVSGVKVTLEGYGNLQNDYLKFSKVEVPGVDTSKVPILNKWIQLRKDGTVEAGVDTSLIELTDPRVEALGDTIFGNFSAKDRADLVAAAKQRPFFKYDATKVKKDTLDGHKVYVYQLTRDKDAFAEYNKKAAKIIGIPDADVETALKKFEDEASDFTAYIRLDTKQLVKTTVKDSSGSLITSLYTDYNKTSLPSEPKSEITYSQFAQGLLTGLGQ